MAAGFLDLNSLSGVYLSSPGAAVAETGWALHRRWLRPYTLGLFITNLLLILKDRNV